MNEQNTTATIIEKKHGRPVRRACLLALAAATCLLMSGCETFRAWGEKSSSTPGTVGGSMSIPLGKKK
ncbi:MAG: hypothetical protein LBM04_04310 [Opitutaceae bacterium]|nr:hypothetical protein [Opitutaceae bacterium]